MEEVEQHPTCFLCNYEKDNEISEELNTPKQQSDIDQLKDILHSAVTTYSLNNENGTQILNKCRVKRESSTSYANNVFCVRCEGLLRNFDHHFQLIKLMTKIISQLFDGQEIEASDLKTVAASFPPAIIKRGRKKGRKRKVFYTVKEDIGQVIVSDESDLGESFPGKLRASRRIRKQMKRRGRPRKSMCENVDEDAVGLEGIPQDPQYTLEKNNGEHRCSNKKKRSDKKTTTGKLSVEGRQKIACPFCSKLYAATGKRPHTCTSFRSLLQCVTCRVFFSSLHPLEKHLKSMHRQKALLKCTICSFLCVAEVAQVWHQHQHEIFGPELPEDVIPVRKLLALSGPGKPDVSVTLDDSVEDPMEVDEVAMEFEEKSLNSYPPSRFIVTKTKRKPVEESVLSDGTGSSEFENGTRFLSKDQLSCPFCNEECQNEQSLEGHIALMHRKETVFDDGKCIFTVHEDPEDSSKVVVWQRKY